MALATLKIRRFKNLEILHSAKQTLLFLLVNSGVDLGGNDTLLATSREASDLRINGSFSESEVISEKGWFWIRKLKLTKISVSFSMALLISSPIASSGHLRSSLVSPLSSMRERKSSSSPISWKSLRFTLGTSMLCVEGQISSSFLPAKSIKFQTHERNLASALFPNRSYSPVKMSRATR